jgi:hypothetical protein
MIFSPEARPVVAPARIRWEDPPCPLCGGERRSPVLEAPDLRPGGSGLRFAIVRCEDCDLHFTSPRPDPATIGQFYPPGECPGQCQTATGQLILANVLEQAHDPLTMLADARRSLGPGEQLIVTVPNIGSTAFRWFGPAWVGLDLPRRLAHFTPATLRRMLEHAGFRVTSLRQVSRAEWWQTSAMQAVRSGAAPLMQRALVLKPLARLAARGCYLAGKSDVLTATASLS